MLAELRAAARIDKNYEYADKIRDILVVIGVEICDTSKGYILKHTNGEEIIEIDI